MATSREGGVNSTSSHPSGVNLSNAEGKDNTGRSYHNDQNASYILPNDSIEHRRLEEQGHLLSELMNGRIIHAPIVSREGQPVRMIDVGCGTGTISRLLAQKFPSAECVGLDLSLLPAEMRARNRGVHFYQGNIQTQKPSQWTPADGNQVMPKDEALFDYVFSRLLIVGISDWSSYTKTTFDLLKPGGWIEVHDTAWDFYEKDGTLISRDWQWFEAVREVCEDQKGMDLRCGSNAAARMKDVGFENVQVFRYFIPLGGHLDTDAEPKLQNFGEWLVRGSFGMFHVLIQRTMKYEAANRDEITDEMIETMQREMRSTLAPRKGFHIWFYVTIGRKPGGTVA